MTTLETLPWLVHIHTNVCGIPRLYDCSCS